MIGPDARNRGIYALGVRNGVVLGAFRIEWWYQAAPTTNRWEFHGNSATDLTHVVGTSIARVKAKQGNASPVRLFLNGIPPETP